MKLYIITREDLFPGQQLAQSIHAARQFAADFPEIEKQWFEQSNTIVCLSVKNLFSLWELIDKAQRHNVKVSYFREPDLENQLTAIALEPTKKTSEICRGLPLALK